MHIPEHHSCFPHMPTYSAGGQGHQLREVQLAQVRTTTVPVSVIAPFTRVNLAYCSFGLS